MSNKDTITKLGELRSVLVHLAAAEGAIPNSKSASAGGFTSRHEARRIANMGIYTQVKKASYMQALEKIGL